MNSKDKEISKRQFKTYLTNMKSAPVKSERSLRPETEKELRPEQPAAQRCKALKDLGEQLKNHSLQESVIMRFWELTQDLIVPNKSAECRQTALTFYKRLIHSQYKNLTLMREHFFLVIKNHKSPEDLRHRLELLEALTENGRDIKDLEKKIGKFMLLWIPAIIDAKQLRPFLDMLINLIKFNAAHLNKDIIVGILQHACYLSCTVEDDDIGLQCLTILEMVMCYAIIPVELLQQCVVTLCRTVNHIPYCQDSWKIMKNLLGTQLGYHSMKMMCNFLNDRSLYDDQQLLRGAVFHLNMNIFSSNIVFHVSPMFYASTVLTSFLNALESRQVIVTYEVILSVRKVIVKYKAELSEIIWDRICDIMSAIMDNIEYYERENINKEHLRHLQDNFHENINCIEKLLQEDQTQLLADVDRIYELIERVSMRRPESSVLSLIEYRSSNITASRPQWLHALNNFVNRFYRNFTNPTIRIKTIQSLKRIIDKNRACYEEEILERVVIPYFGPISLEPDVQIRVEVTKAVVDLARHCDTKRCAELLDTLEKIINRPFEQLAQPGGHGEPSDIVIMKEADICDVVAAVDGLIEIFVIKLYRLPSSHAIKVFNILVGHLEMHYERPRVFELVSVVRNKIFSWMLRARANSSYHIGYADPTKKDAVTFSHYLGIDSLQGLAPQHQRHMIMSQVSQSHDSHFTSISIRRACKLIVKCLESDRDYHVFELVIKGLPKVLQNKALILGNDMDALARVLLDICDENKPLSHLSHKLTIDERHVLVVPAIASLMIYHQFIQPTHQRDIIKKLEMSIFNQNIVNIIIHTLTMMILEMPEVLMRHLSDILVQMGKMSDTHTVAIPVLEFLSILSRLPNHLFINFTPFHYKYVFAISLPYTKPNRYDHYTVWLAHYVIAGWFLKCKLDSRRSVVSHIISSIESNTATLTSQRPDFNNFNEDSSNRKRSTSLTERGSRNARTRSETRVFVNDNMKTFHAELAETCIDFLERHTYSPCSAPPKRLPTVDYLLKNNTSQTWLLGNNVLTITTSGCPSAPTRNGLCDRCAQLGKASNLAGGKAAPLSPEFTGSERRYTKVSLQHSSGNESAGSIDLTSSSSSASAAATQRQTSNSSSTSLEALSRRGSNPSGTDASICAGGSTTSLLGNSLSANSVNYSPAPALPVQHQTCIRSCIGWAEIMIRRPTGDISWIMRIENPMASDCFGQDLPFFDIVSLFLPIAHGGVFGPESDATPLPPPNADVSAESQPNVAGVVSASRESLTAATVEEDRRKAVAKLRALQRQDEVVVGPSSSATVSAATSATAISTAAIDIPKAAGKRGKEAMSGSVSDGEADEETMAFGDGTTRARNPVRRVNSSPEMSSSWRHNFLASKPLPLSQELSHGDDRKTAAKETVVEVHPHQQQQQLQQQQQQQQQQQKKRIVQYTKDMRVSCEAIPEEIAGSTPPQTQGSGGMRAPVACGPVASSSAGDVTSANEPSSTVAAVQQSASSERIGHGKPPLSPAPNQPIATTAAAIGTVLIPRVEKVLLAANTGNSSAQKAGSFNPHMGLAKSSSSGGSNALGVIGGGGSGDGGNGSSADYNIGDTMRGRSKTISTTREVNGKPCPPASSFRGFTAAKPTQLCMSPSFVFMQLYNTGQLKVTAEPLKVSGDHLNVLEMLDFAPPYERHDIGVLYVGRGQCNNAVEILRNSYGSTRYVEFLRNIGTLVSLKDAGEQNMSITLAKDGTDGKFTYVWKDDIMQVTFHVTTLMPTKLKTDPMCNEKKKHVGNDFVHIVYNESGEEYNLSTISGQFSYAGVIVEPLELNTNRIYVKSRPEIAKYVSHSEPKIVSDRSAPLLARQLALHANLASKVTKCPYVSNWLQRLRLIKRLRAKLLENTPRSAVGPETEDHTSDPLNMKITNRDFIKYT